MVQKVIHRYGDHSLQELAVWIPEREDSGDPREDQKKRYWIVFIHGGAWRDPLITHINFAEPAISLLLSSLSTSPGNKIEGIASISYRLSPHPSFPQDRAATTPSLLRDARHPDHVDDVCAGLKLLAGEYGIRDHEYLLVGHSCGATLGYQVLERMATASSSSKGVSTDGDDDPMIKWPAALVGLAGIYDMRSLWQWSLKGLYPETYESFLKGAYGEDMEVWDHCSPARWDEEMLRDIYLRLRVLVLATATGDELVPLEQAEDMMNRILKTGESDGFDKVAEVMEKGKTVAWCKRLLVSVEGGHDEMWQVGERMVKVIETALNSLSL